MQPSYLPAADPLNNTQSFVHTADFCECSYQVPATGLHRTVPSHDRSSRQVSEPDPGSRSVPAGFLPESRYSTDNKKSLSSPALLRRIRLPVLPGNRSERSVHHLPDILFSDADLQDHQPVRYLPHSTVLLLPPSVSRLLNPVRRYQRSQVHCSGLFPDLR